MRAAVVLEPGRLEVREVPRPEAGAGDLLVRTAFFSPCGSEYHVYKGEFGERVKFPAIMGHEMSGIVEEVGEGVKGFEAGERVVLDPISACGGCPACLDGRPNACRSLKLVGIDLAGGYGEFVSAPAEQWYRLPDGVTLEDAALVEVHGIGVHALRRGRVEPGDRVVLIGCGKLGLSILDVLKEQASGAILAVDVDDFRLERARRIGATHVINGMKEKVAEKVLELTEGDGADLVIEAVGHFEETALNPPPVETALEVVRQAGRILMLGQGDQRPGIHWRTLVWKEAEILTSRTSRGVFPRVLRMMEEGRLKTEAVVTHRVGVDETPELFRMYEEKAPGLIKALVGFGPG